MREKLTISPTQTGAQLVMRRLVRDEWERLRRCNITPWVFLNTGEPMRVADFYGTEISYQGVGFEGSPRDVFWGRYIEPFLEDIVFRMLDRTMNLCKEEGHDAKSALGETGKLLKRSVRDTYRAMADVDRRLRGRGFPETVVRRDVQGGVAAMEDLIDSRVASLVTSARQSRRPPEDRMTDAEIELAILRHHIHQHNKANATSPDDKCARELDMRDVLKEIGATSGAELEQEAQAWLARLAPPRRGSLRGPLKRCSHASVRESTHRFHSRAFIDAGYQKAAPAWDRVQELERVLLRSETASSRSELEQKFGIVRAWPQAKRDFEQWREAGVERGTILFLDIDHFKRLNTTHTNVTVDEKILAPFQVCLVSHSKDIGEVYRHGGEEFVIVLPNQDKANGTRVAEELRSIIAATDFFLDAGAERITVSIGVASWPEDGSEVVTLTAAANAAQIEAKESGRNKVVVYLET
jgi:diguanylate cyclase (GGDEF)-like protein